VSGLLECNRAKAGVGLPLLRAWMTLNRIPYAPRRDRQVIFLGSTEPRAARPERCPPGTSSSALR
jgi:hypothetical protein